MISVYNGFGIQAEFIFSKSSLSYQYDFKYVVKSSYFSSLTNLTSLSFIIRTMLKRERVKSHLESAWGEKESG